MYVDEIYPEFLTIPEPVDWLSKKLRQRLLSRWEPKYLKGRLITVKDTSRIKDPLKRHIAEKYNFRNFRTTSAPWQSFVGTEYSLNCGVKLLACGYDPVRHEFSKSNAVFHLILLWRDPEEYNGKVNPLSELKNFLRHLESQPKSDTQAVILRPVSPLDRPIEFEELNVTNFIKSKRVTTDKLKLMYSRVLGAYESKMRDGLGGFFWSVPFDPKDPREKNNSFSWPKLLQKR